MEIKVLGWTDTCTCDKCGRSDLERTCAVEIDGEVAHYGSECVKKVLGAKKGKEVVAQSNIIAEIANVATTKGWTQATEYARRRFGWGTMNGAIVDGIGKPVLKQRAV